MRTRLHLENSDHNTGILTIACSASGYQVARGYGAVAAMRPLVFLVSNDARSCRAIRACLERANYRVREYFSTKIGPEVEMLRPVMVLIEIQSQDSALELCRSIRAGEAGAQTRIVLLVRHSSGCDAAIETGKSFDDCLTRPIPANRIHGAQSGPSVHPRPATRCGMG